MIAANAFLDMACCTNCFDYKNYSQQRISSWATTMESINLTNLNISKFGI